MYVPHFLHYIEKAVNDQFAYGDMESMKKYMAIIDNLCYMITSGISIIHPESLTYANMLIQGLDIVQTGDTIGFHLIR